MKGDNATNIIGEKPNKGVEDFYVFFHKQFDKINYFIIFE